MKILILSSAFSGLTQRVVRELTLLGHKLDFHYDLDEQRLLAQVATFRPDLIICPFLTQRIPEEVWKQYLCLVVHPGIEGDRGPSSLDWAISGNLKKWGVTLLQADSEMDAGDIWGTKNFPMRQASKTSIYKREVSTAAIELIKQALKNFEDRHFIPRPLDYGNPEVKGTLQPMMRQADREIDWSRNTAREIVNKINAACTNPGLRDVINGVEVNLYGASLAAKAGGKPGEVVAIHKGACCRATVDGAVWIRQMKCKSHDGLPAIKLPASTVLGRILPESFLSELDSGDSYDEVEEIRIERQGDIAYVYFNFYNGAANTEQCMELRDRLVALKASDVKYIVYMGGEDFWSNGIHLNCIEAAEDPAKESWRNINAIDNVVREMIESPRQMTIAALRNNAGAGGAIMALACDEVIIRDGVVLNPHYKSMGLYGSEYWTYLLPKRVGGKTAEKIMNECQPMLATEAMELGMADRMFDEDWDAYHAQLREYCQKLSAQGGLETFLKAKAAQRQKDEAKKPLESYRNEELAHMKRIFDNPKAVYHAERKAFVYKQKRKSDSRKSFGTIQIAKTA